MGEKSCNKLICCFAESVFIVWVIESVFTALHKGHICVHTRTVNTEYGLGHKCCVKSVTACICFNNMLEGYNLICRIKSLCKTEVDFVLSLCNLVVGSLNLITHFLQSKANIASALLTLVGRSHIEITCNIGCFCGGLAFFIKLEKEELALRAYIEGITHIGGFFYCLSENISGVACKRSNLIGTVNIADKACNAVLPGKKSECIVIGL